MTMDNELRIVQGNTFATAIEIHAVDATGQPIADWSLQESTDLRVWYVFAGREQDITAWQIDDGKLVILWLANMQRVGTYDIFCAGKYNGADWRNAMQYQFRIVRFNHEANIPANVVILDGVYQLSAELQIITQFAEGGGGTPSQTIPFMDGEAAVGEENAYARGDHRHPSDTSKQATINASHKLSADLVDDDSTTNKFVTSAEKTTWNGKSDFSGSYNDLTNKPTIPAAQIQSDWDQADNTKKDYIKNKPTIPAAQVQANWNESDTDSKAYIQNKPTIPAAQVQSNWNESDTNSKAYIQNKPTIPAAGIPAGGNAGQVLTKTDGSTDYAVAWRDTNNIFTSAYCTTAAATAAKNASCTFWTATANSYLHILITRANSNQGALTLNVNSTGAAPIYINGTASSATNYTLPAGSYIVFYDGTNYYFRTDGKLTANITGTAAGTPVVNHGTSDTTFALTPNVWHKWGTVSSLNLTLATPADNTIVNEYMIEFESGATATTLTLPNTVVWGDSCGAISVEANKIYQISIVGNLATWESWSN